LQRLIELDEAAQALAKEASLAERQIAEDRNIFNGVKHVEPERHRQVKAINFDLYDKQVKDQRQRADTEARILTKIKTWITMLGQVKFQAVKVDAAGWTLESARKRLAAIDAEIKALESAPRPSADIKARLEIYVRMLAQAGRPIFYRGLNVEGAELTIMYPADIGANPRNLNGYSPTDWHPLLKEAYLRPAELLARLIQEVHDISQRPLPPSRRGARIRELQSETADLAFIEEEALRQA